MMTNVNRWIILLLALVCAVQAVSAFEMITEEITPASASLEPEQEVTACYLISYRMLTAGRNQMDDETFEFSTGLQRPTWDFKIRREGYPDIAIPTRGGAYQTLLEFEIGYEGEIQLDVQLRGTVPKASSGEIEVVKIEHFRDKTVEDVYRMTRKVVSAEQVGSSLSVQQQNLKTLKADIDARAAEGVDVSAAQAKYDDASQALTSAASAAPSKAAEHIATAVKAMDEAKSLLDKAWAENEVANAGVALESLDTKINYFIEERSMGGDPRVVSIVTKRESAAQFYSQAKDGLSAKSYQQARSKADDGLNRANEALRDADALRDAIGGEFNPGGNMLLYIGIGVMVVIALSAGYFIHSKRTTGGRKRGARARKTRPPIPPPVHGDGQTLRSQGAALPFSEKSAGLSKTGVSDGGNERPTPYIVLPERKSTESTAKPEISITLSHTTIYADEWDKIGLTLVNAGTAHAFDITLTFPNDIDTRLIQPVNLAPGTSTIIEAGIKPRAKGKVPLEIIVRYRDAENQTYKQTTSFWLLVEPRNDSLSPDSPIPSSIPRPMTPKSLPQEMADRYTASEFLGKGGFARVFKVQKSDGSWVALKIPISLDAATGRSFITELQNWTTLVHENIVRVNDYNIMPFPYFELELCDGTLAELEKPVPPEHAAWLIFNICEGLKYAHARGILHRDLKPQNIMLRDGVPKISDWGLSKVMTQSRATTISGGFTAYYAAPEQIANRIKGPRTDIWQLGVILYELVTGRLPFTGESMVEIGMAIVTRAPERPGAVHPDAQPLDSIILKCLEKQPKQRYRSVAALQKDLAAYLKINYTETLKESIQTKNFHRSAYYCGDLVLISMKIGNLADAYKYAVDLARYSAGEARTQAAELARQIKARVEMGAQELPEELIRKAEMVVHQVRVQ